jgi:hypothetical protein
MQQKTEMIRRQLELNLPDVQAAREVVEIFGNIQHLRGTVNMNFFKQKKRRRTKNSSPSSSSSSSSSSIDLSKEDDPEEPIQSPTQSDADFVASGSEQSNCEPSEVSSTSGDDAMDTDEEPLNSSSPNTTSSSKSSSKRSSKEASDD